MKRYDLSGTWTLRNMAEDAGIEGHLPGCNYLDLIRAGRMEDPFWGQNEEGARKTAQGDFRYQRSFSLGGDLRAEQNLDLVVSGLDTLARIRVNGREIASTNNVHRTYRLPVRDLVQPGENRIEILLENPLPYIQKQQALNPLIAGGNVKGISHLRKVQSHFGWDWGPNLPPAGLSGEIALEAYSLRIDEVRIRQEHRAGAVTLKLGVRTTGGSAPASGAIQDRGAEVEVRCVLTAPDKSSTAFSAGLPPGVTRGEAAFSIPVENPALWWCNGLGEPKLYTLSVSLVEKGTGTLLDTQEKTIGLRTIELDRTPDAGGARFRFLINGVPVFARGADWIPSDIFVTRTTEEDLRFYIESAQWANMNMLRVWGGGYYESDRFYDLCDQKGILVWQDFCFACGAYPFMDKEFLENVRQEVIDNVKRLRHHAGLALWCGNNETEILTELLAKLQKRKKALCESNRGFYFDTLKAWVEELDGVTPYWPGSPSSGDKDLKAQNMGYGDTHLWGVWHGLMPIEAFRKWPTRFCSEFGLESFPSLRAVRSFTDAEEPDIRDPVMMAHQKSAGGNQKILFYLLAKYRAPAKFSGMVYLSQLVQSGAMRFATDQWRRNMARSGGAIYWQYNDCWPVASWAGIDYRKQYKAVHYHARHFNKPLCLSNDYFKDRSEIYLANDLPRPFSGSLEWKLRDFSGRTLNSGTVAVEINGTEAKRILTLGYKTILGEHKKNSVLLQLTLGNQDGPADEKIYLLVPDKYAALPKPRIQYSCAVKDNGSAVEITLKSDVYARYVYVEVDGLEPPLSDNFFDINGGETRVIRAEIPAKDRETLSAASIEKGIRLCTLADVEPRNSLAVDRLRRFLMRFYRINFITWLLFKFV